MFAVIRTGGKQYRVAPNDIIEIERIAAEPGDIVELGEVLLLGGGDGGPQAGKPLIAGALVAAEVVEQGRGEKIIVFKKKRRKNYRRTKGHRQLLTTLRITEILTDGKKPSKAAAKPEPKKAKKKPVEVKADKKPVEKKAAAKPAPKRAAPVKAKPEAKKSARAKPKS
jgi:large subunit ribosomal protein L21